ncbi:hypothetical protein BD408DRAFT_486864 [Parasitella parasitica]|nr:hypothetical protein BD408DRAFT_486864 [Parasitella parasitica]
MNSNTQSSINSNMHSVRVQTELEMRQSIGRTNQAKLDDLPENTNKAYEPKIKEFRNWCDVKFAHEPQEMQYIVAGEKARFFLDNAVVGGLSSSKRRRVNAGGGSPARLIKFSLLDQYGAALVRTCYYNRPGVSMMHPLPSLKAMKTMTGGRIGGYISFSQVLMTDYTL